MANRNPDSPTGEKKPAARSRSFRPRHQRGGGPKLLSRMVERLTKPVFGKRGFAHGTIINQWADIVGPELARMTAPEKIIFSRNGNKGGVLHLRIASGSLATELQHLEPLIVERINQHFGYGAVRSLRMVQGPLPGATPETAPPSRTLSPAAARQLADSLAGVDDPEIRAALEGLGRAMGGRDAGKKG